MLGISALRALCGRASARLLRPARRRAGYASRKAVVMFDCENISPGCYPAVMDIAEREGSSVDVRLYGPAQLLAKKAWRSLAADGRAGSITFVEVGSGGKNSSDIAIAADAIMLAVKGEADVLCFVLVSSDGDFAPLAQRLRAIGCRVHGIGAAEPTATYAPECDSWTRLDSAKGYQDCTGRTARHGCSGDELNILAESVAACTGADGWADLAEVGMRIRLAIPDFRARDYGAETLKELLRATGEYDLLSVGDKCLARLR